MSALRRFLSRDARALALLVSLMAGPAGAREPGDLTRLDGEAARLEAATAFLKDSAERCLRHQREMVDGIAALGPPSAEGKAEGAQGSAAKAFWDPVGMRQARLDLYLVQNPRDRLLDILDGTVPKGAVRAEMEHHLALRRACLAWSDRALGAYKDILRRPPSADAEARLEAARQAGARDARRLRGIEGQKRPVEEADIDMMESGRPVP